MERFFDPRVPQPPLDPFEEPIVCPSLRCTWVREQRAAEERKREQEQRDARPSSLWVAIVPAALIGTAAIAFALWRWR